MAKTALYDACCDAPVHLVAVRLRRFNLDGKNGLLSIGTNGCWGWFFCDVRRRKLVCMTPAAMRVGTMSSSCEVCSDTTLCLFEMEASTGAATACGRKLSFTIFAVQRRSGFLEHPSHTVDEWFRVPFSQRCV